MFKNTKYFFVYTAIVLSVSAIVLIFWYEEIRYALPTPLPKSYKVIDINTTLTLDKFIEEQKTKPVFLHFFNPDCPCSRFNISHFEDLLDKYNDRVSFYAVLQTENKKRAIQTFKERYQLNIPVILDTGEFLAKHCGVYATPQAVLLDVQSKLYYRGNYNRARYCTDPGSNYAQMAIDSVLAHRKPPHFGKLATKSYGCQLPSEKQDWF